MRRAKTEKTALGGGVPSIFVETVVINYFPYSLRLYSHFSDSSCADTKEHMFTHNRDFGKLESGSLYIGYVSVTNLKST